MQNNLPNSKSFVLVQAADWQALYRDGVLVADGPTVNVEEVLALLGYELATRKVKESWLNGDIDFAPKLSDIVLGKQ